MRPSSIPSTVNNNRKKKRKKEKGRETKEEEEKEIVVVRDLEYGSKSSIHITKIHLHDEKTIFCP